MWMLGSDSRMCYRFRLVRGAIWKISVINQPKPRRSRSTRSEPCCKVKNRKTVLKKLVVGTPACRNMLRLLSDFLYPRKNLKGSPDNHPVLLLHTAAIGAPSVSSSGAPRRLATVGAKSSSFTELLRAPGTIPGPVARKTPVMLMS